MQLLPRISPRPHAALVAARGCDGGQQRFVPMTPPLLSH